MTLETFNAFMLGMVVGAAIGKFVYMWSYRNYTEKKEKSK